MLDNKLPNFSASLANLDQLPSQYTDNVFMLYVKDGVTKVDDILATQVSILQQYTITCTSNVLILLQIL